MTDLTAAAERLAASAGDQGFPLLCSDPSVLGRIAGILADGRNDERGASTPRVRHRRKEVPDVQRIERSSARR